MTLLRHRSASRLVLLSLLVLGCDPEPVPDAGTPMDATPRDAANPTTDAGPPCSSDEECDDGVDCTDDSCGPNLRCRNLTNHAVCQNGEFCDGVERCDVVDGCVSGPRETCNDMDVCTVDRCNEETDTCDYAARDLDMDGDVDFFCAGGGDCDDRNPTVSSLLNEVCADSRDNDCDGTVDEATCGRPLYDTCDAVLDVSAGGYYMINTAGTARDYTHGCGPSPPVRDVVAAFTLTERRSVTIEAEPDISSVTLSLRTTCPDRSTDLACRYGFPPVIRQRALEPGPYFIMIGGSGNIGLRVTFDDPIDPPPNDTCATPTDVSAGGSFPGAFVEVTDTQTMSCSNAGSGELFYSFMLAEEKDVVISAIDDAGGWMSFSVRSTCTDAGTELRCERAIPASGRLHRLPMGTYFIVVEDPTGSNADFTLDVAFEDPTDPAQGDTCSDPIPITTDGTPVAGTLLGKENDIPVSCGIHYRDAVYTFHLDAPADVTYELDAGGLANVSLRSMCSDEGTQVRCTAGEPVFQRVRNLAAGDYFLIVEANDATSYNLSVTESAPTTPTMVTGNDRCDMAGLPVITAPGGLYTGSTLTPISPDYTVSSACTGAGGATANDAVFQLDLTNPTSRVIVSTEGSAYDTVVHIHSGACMSGGQEFCNDDQGSGLVHSYLDVDLPSGTHYIVVDGFGSAGVGEYVLEVLIDP